MRVKRHDGGLHVDVLRGVGFRAACSQGFRGPVRDSYKTAKADGREHTHDEGNES